MTATANYVGSCAVLASRGATTCAHGQVVGSLLTVECTSEVGGMAPRKRLSVLPDNWH